MPFSYDVDPTQSNRAYRRRNTQESKSLDNNVINTKALGARISDIRYDPNAIDGDGDGLVQEGSPYERPAVLSNVAGLVRGLSSRSSTGAYGYTSEGSWTKGLTNDEIAERAIPDSPAKAVEAISASIGVTGSTQTLDNIMKNIGETVEGGVDGLIFDEKKIERLRKTLANALDESPEFRQAVDKFGMPPILLAKYTKEHGAAGTMYESVVMTIGDTKLGGLLAGFEGPGQRIGSFFAMGLKFKGTKRHTVGSSIEETMVHEWGHYLNFLTVNIHPDAKQRELAGSLTRESWFDMYGSKSSSPELNSLFTYMDDISRNGDYNDKHEVPPDDVPWINTSYGQSSPVEFFAESVGAYFSPDKKKRALLNEAGTRVVERMLGTQGNPVGGLSSRTVHDKDLTKLSNVEIAELVVPDSPQRLQEMMTELNDLRGGSDVPMDESLMESFGDVNAIDFHPVRVAQMKEHVANMLEANPEFKRVVQAYGMPPVAFATPDYKWDPWDTPPMACYSTNGAPMILFNPTPFDKAQELDNWMEAPSRNFLDKIKKRLVTADANTTEHEGLPDTKYMAVGTDYNGTLIHEWSHYIHDLAMYTHPDEQTRNDMSFFWNKDWESAKELGEALDLMPDGRSQLFDLTGDMEDAIDKGIELPETTPFVRTWYGQSSPVEMFAEGIAAYLHSDGKYKDLNSKRMNNIIDRMFNPPSGDEVVDVLTADTSRATSGLSSRIVKRDGNGVRDINDTFNALSGADWLKDATDEEIADAVVPMNVEDMIEMSLHTSMYGRPDTTDPRIIQAFRDIFTDLFVKESEGKVFLDFTPEGREKAKKIVRDALAESPEFAWAVRQFGLPPILVTDGKGIHDFIANGGSPLDMYSTLQPNAGGVHGTAGWSTGSFYIAINMANQGIEMDLASGFQPKVMRRIGPDGEPYITNFGLSRADTLRHEFGHYLWTSMCVNVLRKDGATNRDERAEYFFPHLSKDEAKDRITELYKTFDATATILSSEADVRAKYLKLVLDSNASQEIKDGVTQAIASLDLHPSAWSPALTNQAQGLIESLDPKYTRFPILNGQYALYTRQELWAESVSLFFSPDKGMRERYMSDELRGYVARAMGLQVDSNGRHERPWRASGGLSSRVEPVSKRTITIADNFSSKPTGTDRRDFTPLPVTLVTPLSPSTMSITLGDDKWVLSTGDNMPALWNVASEAWSTEEGHNSMRLISASILGLGTMGDNDSNGITGVITSGRTSGGDTGVRDEVREMAQHTFSGLHTIHEGDNITDKPHSRVLEDVSPNSPLMTTDLNSDITIPLTSFGDESRTREVLTTPSDVPRTLVTLRDNAQVALLKDDEVVTAGVFKIVRRDTTNDGITRIELQHTRTFDASQGRTAALRSLDSSGLASSSTPLRRTDSGLPEKTQERFQTTIDTKRKEIEELNDVNSRLRLAMEELQATGSWQGEKHDVRVNEQGVRPPITITKEQIDAEALKQGISSEDYIANLINNIEIAGRNRKKEIDALDEEVLKLEETKDFITKDRPENSFHIEELLTDPALAEELRRRSAELEPLSTNERAQRFSDPNDPDAVYVIHWGAADLEGGEIDPARSRGQLGANVPAAGNTRLINDQTARYMVGKRDSAKRDLSILEEMKRQVESDGVIDFDAIARTDMRDGMRAGRARLLLGLNRRDPERSTLIPEGWQASNLDGRISDEKRTISSLDKVADQLIADDYQYTSTYRATALQDLFSSYGGRYAGEDSGEWGDNLAKSSSTGIHIFRVKIGEDAIEENSVGETHLVGKHTPIASLVAENTPGSTNPASDTWAGWVDMAIQQDIANRPAVSGGLSSRLDEPAIEPSMGGLSSRQSRSAKKITKTFRVDGKPRPRPANRQELISRAVPTDSSQLFKILKESPFMKGKSEEEVLDLLNRMEIDWEAQAKLATKLDKVLKDSAGFEELLNEFDIPLMVVTRSGAVPSEFGRGHKRSSVLRWDNIEGEYHPESGFISFPTRIVNQDTVTNPMSDGPLSTEDVIRHELSHTIHAMAMGRSKKARKAYEKDTEEMIKTLEEAIATAERMGLSEIKLSSVVVLPGDEHELAGRVSRYAQTKRSEYIAELLAHMLPGKNTKPVIMLEDHYAMLSEFLDIPVARLRELASMSSNSSVPWV